MNWFISQYVKFSLASVMPDFFNVPGRWPLIRTSIYFYIYLSPLEQMLLVDKILKGPSFILKIK